MLERIAIDDVEVTRPAVPPEVLGGVVEEVLRQNAAILQMNATLLGTIGATVLHIRSPESAAISRRRQRGKKAPPLSGQGRN